MTRIAGVFVVLLGLWAWLLVALQWNDAERKQNWLPTHATVESSRIRSTIIKGRSRDYFAEVTYTYEAGGATQRGTKPLHVARIESSQDQSRSFEKVYYKGRRLEVFYDPAHPNESTLQNSSLGDLWKSALGGFVAVAFGVMLWRYAPLQKD